MISKEQIGELSDGKTTEPSQYAFSGKPYFAGAPSVRVWLKGGRFVRVEPNDATLITESIREEWERAARVREVIQSKGDDKQ